MKPFQIDFFELSFLAEACIPPNSIGRTHLWQKLTSLYWHKMDKEERKNLFQKMNENHHYKKSLEEKNKDVLVFHARFDPDNQYSVETMGNETHNAFKFKEKYHVDVNTHIRKEIITKIEKLNP